MLRIGFLEESEQAVTETPTYLVATTKSWNLTAFERVRPTLPDGYWHLICNKDDLTLELIDRIAPRYIFFPHWSWLVPEVITDRVECVCFHATDLPFGRGGSPIQNLIARGHRETMISALRMVRELDAGPIYLKRPLSLGGSARDIFARIGDLTMEMISAIATIEPEPQPQSGEAVIFPRRTPDESEIPVFADMRGLYDHIRMLDADSYPSAFVDYGPWRLTFGAAELDGGEDSVSARVQFKLREKTKAKS